MAKAKKSSFRGAVSKDVKRHQAQGSSYGHLLLPKGVSVYNPKPGSKVTLDFMPYMVTDDRHPDKQGEEFAYKGSIWYKRPYKIHKNVGANKETVVCPTSFGKKCPICEYRIQRQKEGADKDELQTMKAQLRVLYLVIPLDSPEHKKEVHIMDVSHYLFQEHLQDELDESPEYEVFPDLEEGYSVYVRWKSETIGNSKPFADAGKIDFKERKKQYKESMIKELPSLDNVLNCLSYKELDAKFLEMDPDDIVDEDEDEDDDTPKKKGAAKKNSRKPEPEPEEDEDEDDDDEEEEEEEEEESNILEDIDSCKKVAELIALAKEHPEYFDKKTLKKLEAIKKVSDLKAAMLELIPTDEEEEEDDEDEDDDSSDDEDEEEDSEDEEDEEEDEDEEDSDKDDPDTPTWEDLEGMSYTKLAKYCKENKLKINPKDYDDDPYALRVAIGKLFGIKAPKKKK